MKRFEMHERVQLETVPQDKDFWGQSPVYKPYERVRAKAPNGWQLVERCDNDKLAFYLENLHTKERRNEESGGMEAYRKAQEHFEYYSSLPPGVRPEGQQQQASQAEPPAAKSEKQLQAEKSEEALKKVEASFKEMDAKLKAGEAEFNAEMTRRKFNEMKASMSELEKQMQASTPEGNNDSE